MPLFAFISLIIKYLLGRQPVDPPRAHSGHGPRTSDARDARPAWREREELEGDEEHRDGDGGDDDERAAFPVGTATALNGTLRREPSPVLSAAARTGKGGKEEGLRGGHRSGPAHEAVRVRLAPTLRDPEQRARGGTGQSSGGWRGSGAAVWGRVRWEFGLWWEQGGEEVGGSRAQALTTAHRAAHNALRQRKARQRNATQRSG